MTTIKATVLAACVACTGCASVPVYTPPIAFGNSVLHFATHNYQLLQFYENGSNCTESRGLKPADNPLQNPDRSMIVTANKQVAVTLIASGIGHLPISACHVTLSFKLPPNGSYRLVGSANAKECTAQIIDVNQGGVADPASVNLILMRKNSPLGFMHDGCARIP